MTEPTTESETCPDCGRAPWDHETRPADFCVEISGYWPNDFNGDSCARRTIANLRAELDEKRSQQAREDARALRVLDELEHLVRTHKWTGRGSKEAAWGRAYEKAMRELRAKYEGAAAEPAVETREG